MPPVIHSSAKHKYNQSQTSFVVKSGSQLNQADFFLRQKLQQARPTFFHNTATDHQNSLQNPFEKHTQPGVRARTRHHAQHPSNQPRIKPRHSYIIYMLQHDNVTKNIPNPHNKFNIAPRETPSLKQPRDPPKHRMNAPNLEPMTRQALNLH